MNSPAKLMRRPAGNVGFSIRNQPDDPGSCTCPTCGQSWPDDDADVERFLRRNAGKVEAPVIARALRWPMKRLERFARRRKFDLTFRPEREAEPVGS